MTMLGEKVNAFFTNLVFDSMKQREEKNIVRTDVIHLLMEAKKGNLKPDESDEQDGDLKNSTKTQITDIDIAAQALVFFFAGFDSVSALMCFMAYELAINADVQARLRAEITDHDGPITYEAILQMKYLDMVISGNLSHFNRIQVEIFPVLRCRNPPEVSQRGRNGPTVHQTVHNPTENAG